MKAVGWAVDNLKTTKTQQAWLGVHLYYSEPWDEFLQKAIKPYVNTVLNMGAVDLFFFVRYWERGPHIRLRFKGDQEVLENILKPNIKEYFEHYFEARPSERVEPNFHPDLQAEHRWLHNNTLHYIEYIPEYERFGGKIGMAIAEEQFCASSNIVLQSLRTDTHWSYDDALGTAIKLHLSMVAAMGLSLNKAQLFFQQVFRQWLPGAFKFNREILNWEQFQQHAKITIQSFDKAFELDKDNLVAYHHTLWNALETFEEFEEEEFNDWVRANRLVGEKLNYALESNKLQQRPTDYQLKMTVATTPEDQLLWAFYADFVHLTNNRLGILNRDEGYLAYLTMKSMETLQLNGD